MHGNRFGATPTCRTSHPEPITGLGVTGYRLALDAAIAAIEEP
ncbi:hypothetical protein TVNIR_0475 [Thioalkalivibrio nitratireducens DSM 14787]|uniref:Uncharacterized protein n=1 Tax=Thioalkalivibrio nitratireducens (strain DSM 14787 / UNIQEM 213 / ALEN2) TaxID=1255043 RepID=L0DT56_THIND|nr:hypothetical protein TVNIR_0475 [Thioalkalivibrio nitratireducens DSM 14787]